jgi:threonine aldolase
MDFRSDNVHGVSPQIIDANAAANVGSASSYGGDDWTSRLETRFCELFEKEVAVFPVVTGTAANALGLSAITPPFGAIFCHANAHTNTDECGAPEFFTGGAKLFELPTPGGKITPRTLTEKLSTFIRGNQGPKPSTVSITQATELGTVYSVGEIAAIGECAKASAMHLHMDGARFANALVSLNCSPAEMTWRAGVDVLSFGATKNGAMAAEAVVFLNMDLATDFGYRRTRAGQVISKSRFLACQLEAYLSDDLWLHNARQANGVAQQLAKALTDTPGVRLSAPVEANELFPIVPRALATAFQDTGILFHEWAGSGAPGEAWNADETMLRLVTSFAANDADVEIFKKTCKNFI